MRNKYSYIDAGIKKNVLESSENSWVAYFVLNMGLYPIILLLDICPRIIKMHAHTKTSVYFLAQFVSVHYKLWIIWMFISQWISKQTMMCVYNELLLSNQTE